MHNHQYSLSFDDWCLSLWSISTQPSLKPVTQCRERAVDAQSSRMKFDNPRVICTWCVTGRERASPAFVKGVGLALRSSEFSLHLSPRYLLLRSTIMMAAATHIVAQGQDENANIGKSERKYSDGNEPYILLVAQNNLIDLCLIHAGAFWLSYSASASSDCLALVPVFRNCPSPFRFYKQNQVKCRALGKS